MKNQCNQKCIAIIARTKNISFGTPFIWLIAFWVAFLKNVCNLLRSIALRFVYLIFTLLSFRCSIYFNSYWLLFMFKFKLCAINWKIESKLERRSFLFHSFEIGKWKNANAIELTRFLSQDKTFCIFSLLWVSFDGQKRMSVGDFYPSQIQSR